MALKEISVKKYVVRLSAEERKQLEDFVGKGKHSAQLVKARILLKADVSAEGEGWSDSRIAEALDTSKDTVLRTRGRLVEEGVEAVLSHIHPVGSAAEIRRRGGSKADRAGVRTGAQGMGPVELATAGREGRRTEDR